MIPFAITYPAHKCAYIRVNKCATQALTRALDAALDTAGRYEGGWVPADYFMFAFVRNPYDRLVSTYFNQIRRPTNFSRSLFRNGMHKAFWRYPGMHPGMSFFEFACAVANIPDWQANPHFKSQHRFLTYDDTGELMPDRVFNFEALQAGFSRICRHLDVEAARVPVVNRSTRDLWPRYYTRDLAGVVYKRFQSDFEMFGYGRDLPG